MTLCLNKTLLHFLIQTPHPTLPPLLSVSDRQYWTRQESYERFSYKSTNARIVSIHFITVHLFLSVLCDKQSFLTTSLTVSCHIIGKQFLIFCFLRATWHPQIETIKIKRAPNQVFVLFQKSIFLLIKLKYVKILSFCRRYSL